MDHAIYWLYIVFFFHSVLAHAYFSIFEYRLSSYFENTRYNSLDFRMNFNPCFLGRSVIFFCCKNDIYFVLIIFFSTESFYFVELDPIICCLEYFFPPLSINLSIFNQSLMIYHFYKTWPDPLGVSRMGCECEYHSHCFPL